MLFYPIQAQDATFSAKLDDQLADLICTIESLRFAVQEGLNTDGDDPARDEALLDAIYVIGRSLEQKIAKLEAVVNSQAVSE